MGAAMSCYLDAPILEQERSSGSSLAKTDVEQNLLGVSYGACAEDAHITAVNFDVSAGLSLFAVFDGHGGAEVAQYCAARFGDVLKSEAAYKFGDYASALRDAFLRIDETLRSDAGLAEVSRLADEHSVAQKRINDAHQPAGDGAAGAHGASAAQDDDERPGFSSGCTAVVVLLDRKRRLLWCANAGDSRAVLLRGGAAVALSYDHKPEDALESRRIELAGGHVVDGRVDGNLNLSRALGDLRYKAEGHLGPHEQRISALPDVLEVELREGLDGGLVLICDGITGVMENDDVAARLAAAPAISAVDAAADLCCHCVAVDCGGDGTGCDNETVLVVRFSAPAAADGKAPQEPRTADLAPFVPGPVAAAAAPKNDDEAPPSKRPKPSTE
ncbi:phosphatase 2C-like domain-containing protein [Pelagophyceae sp. CCMP2097]|nr:phosphatase 2C-like domain-containing protein [Pelagophyceae sp. CCMP2097]